MQKLYAGQMTGTSLDGIDGVLAEFSEQDFKLYRHLFTPFTDELRAGLYQLISADHIQYATLARIEQALSEHYAEHLLQLIAALPQQAELIAAGCHGQTLQHLPDQGYSWQLLNAALIAERTGQHIIYDFRRRDLALQGQGAPLVPAFQQAYLTSTQQDRVFLNLGGIANITWLPRDPSAPCLGFDTGPANTLLDAWYQRHWPGYYDDQGHQAASGQILPTLLKTLEQTAYFHQPPPKSTGREAFHLAWLEACIGTKTLTAWDPRDVLATLVELTAITVAQAVNQLDPYAASQIFYAGGGGRNRFLIQRLRAHLEPRRCCGAEAIGIQGEEMEALAFAWLAYRFCTQQTGNLPSVTGAQAPRILGSFCPGRQGVWF